LVRSVRTLVGTISVTMHAPAADEPAMHTPDRRAWWPWAAGAVATLLIGALAWTFWRFLLNGPPEDPGPPMTVVFNWLGALKP
jgi:hypothetical protein